MLAASGTPISHIQLLGRWSSAAVERYVQQAPLTSVPSIPSRVFQQQQVEAPPQTFLQPAVNASSSSASRPATSEPTQVVDNSSKEKKTIQAMVTKLHALESEVTSLKTLISTPEVSFVVRQKSDIVHVAAINEIDNEPVAWQTKCGWHYGTRRFSRVPRITDSLRKCLKCFQLDPADALAPGGGQIDSDSESSESSSSESEQEAPVDELPEGGVI